VKAKTDGMLGHRYKSDIILYSFWENKRKHHFNKN